MPSRPTDRRGRRPSARPIPRSRFDCLSNLSRRRLPEARTRSRSSTISTRTRTATASCSRSTRRATTRWCRRVVGVWRTRDWQEREVFDLLGVRFDGPPRPAPHPHARGLGRAIRCARTSSSRGVPRHLDVAGEPAEGLRTHGTRRIRSRGRARRRTAGSSTEEMTLSMGPQHPSTHGVLRFVVQRRRRDHAGGDPRHRLPAPLDREDRREGRLPRLHAVHRPRRLRRRDAVQPGLGDGVREARRHRGAEARRVLPRDRRRAQPHRRAICSRSARWRWTSAPRRRSRTRIREREYINDLLEELCGARLTFNYMRIGGVAWDLPPGWREKALAYVDRFEPLIDEFNALISYNKIYVERLANVAVITRRGGDRLQPGRPEPARLGRQVRHPQGRCRTRSTPSSTSTCRSARARWARSATASTATSSACARCRSAAGSSASASSRCPDGPVIAQGAAQLQAAGGRRLRARRERARRHGLVRA